MVDAIAPDGSEIRFLVPPPESQLAHLPPVDREARAASLVEVRLPEGARSRPVRHRSVEEIWYVLSGRGRLWRSPPGGPRRCDPLGPGVVAVIPTGWTFSFASEGGGALRFLCYTSPPWPGAHEAVVAP
ncbi:MAG: cupin domain-containing protein [Candidatus Dormibacteraceae bacterium]